MSSDSSAENQPLDSFDPHAVHPFTNGSGLQPQPPEPSQYPIPIPSLRRPSASSPSYAQYYDDEKQALPSSLSSTVYSQSPSSPPHAPQPRQFMNTSRSPTQPIFAPFRHEASSPDLVLKKKAPITKSASTQTSHGS